MAEVAACDRGVGWTMERSYVPTGPASDDDGNDDDSPVDNRGRDGKTSNYLAMSRFSVFPLTIEQSRSLSGSL